MSSVRSADVLAAAAARRPAAMRSAKPSTTAVLPTPASPVRIGLFCRRRIRMSTIWRISSSRPMTGSISPLRACSVRSIANASAPPACPSPPAPSRRWPRPARGADASVAPSAASGEPPTMRGEILGQGVGLDLLELPRDRRAARCAATASSACRPPGGRCAPASSPNISVPNTQPRSTAFSTCADRSEIEVAPRGSRSSAAVRSAASRDGSSSKCRTMRCRSESCVCRI